MESIVRSRTGVEKYAEVVSATTMALFSVNPSLIASFYTFLLTHWPRGCSEKTVALSGFIENLLAASPPLYLTPFLKPVALQLFKRICRELLGSQLEISKRAAYFLQNYYIRNNYIAMDESISDVVKRTLTKGSGDGTERSSVVDHWNEVVASTCEKTFDLMLDDF